MESLEQRAKDILLVPTNHTHERAFANAERRIKMLLKKLGVKLDLDWPVW